MDSAYAGLTSHEQNCLYDVAVEIFNRRLDEGGIRFKTTEENEKAFEQFVISLYDAALTLKGT